MRTNLLINLLLPILIFAGCTQTDEPNTDDRFVRPGEPYIYMERDPSYPLILAKPMALPRTRGIGLELEDYLGRSFRTDYFPFENVENIGYPVIDVARIEADGLTWASAKKIRKSQTTSFAYRDYERYVDNSMIVNKVKSGFQIKIGLFKIGNKKTMTEIFKTEFEKETDYVMGQLDVEIRDALYGLQLNSNTLNQIRARYLHPDFKDNLYNLHPSEFFQTYGGFVLTNFITGGRATALYAGRHTRVSTAEMMENDMTLDIAASFGFNSDDTGEVGFGFGGNFNNGKASSGKFSQMQTSIVTQGGGYGHGAFTVPEATSSLNINLSAWGASMDDESKHTIIDIAEEGLLPLTGLIIEDNLRTIFSRYYENGVDSIEEYVEPVLLLDYYPVDGYDYYYKLFIGIRTRTGDSYIVNWLPGFYMSEEGFTEILNTVIERYRKIYKLKIIFYPGLDNGIPWINNRPNGNLYLPYMEHEMVKYHHPETNMLYIVHEQQKVGYSIYVKDDYLLDTYTIREWVDSLPEKEITMNELNSYKLIAL